MSVTWRPGQGRLGRFDPLLGSWVAEGAGPAGLYHCERRFDRVLGGAYVQLVVTWAIEGGVSEELALFAPSAEGELTMWSFTSDGRQAQGRWVEPWDLPRPNLAFEADMPSGRARFAYWPDKPAGGVRYVVEARDGRTWRRLLEHVYTPLGA